MVFAAVDPSIREKVVAAYLAGKGRNQIDREFRSQGIKLSHGSISNFINTYKREHEQQTPSPSQSSTTMVHNIPSLNMTDDMKNNNSPNSWDGLVNINDQDVDFDSQPYEPETQTDTLLDDVEYNAALDGESGERLLNYTDVDQQSEVPKKPDIERDSHISDARHDAIKEIKEIKEPIVKDQSRQSEDSLGLGIDWYAGHQTRFVKWVMEEKRARQ